MLMYLLIGRCSRIRPPDVRIPVQDTSIQVLRRDWLGGLVHEYGRVT
jgi:hypothetical protein